MANRFPITVSIIMGQRPRARWRGESPLILFEYVRHLYRALRQVGLITEYDGSTIKGTERKLKPKDETHRKHTYYMPTDRGEQALRQLQE